MEWQVLAVLAQPVDLEEAEWQQFAQGIASIARQQERTPNDFSTFQSWHDRHGPFDFVIDGANVALYGQNWAEGGFSFGQIEDVLGKVQQAKPDAKVLMVCLLSVGINAC